MQAIAWITRRLASWHFVAISLKYSSLAHYKALEDAMAGGRSISRWVLRISIFDGGGGNQAKQEVVPIVLSPLPCLSCSA